MPRPSPVLPLSIALVDCVLARPQTARAFNSADDPLAINLPPLGEGVGASAIDRATLEVMAALYFQAELEQAGVIPVAEVLTEARFQLQVRDAEAAQRLEDFASGMQAHWYSRQLRQQLFARTLGLGAGASAAAGQTVNREFETRFAQLCDALGRYEADARWSAPTSGVAARVEMTISALLNNLARRRFGNTLIAAQRIQDQLRAALELLNHPGTTQLLQATNIWGVIRNILGPDAPDMARLIDRAQSGTRILTWLAEHLSQLKGAALQQLLRAESSLFLWAATWIRASGYVDQTAPQSGYAQPGYRQSGYGQPPPGSWSPAPGGGSAGGVGQWGR